MQLLLYVLPVQSFPSGLCTICVQIANSVAVEVARPSEWQVLDGCVSSSPGTLV